jgi:integrase
VAKALTPLTVAKLRARPQRYEVPDGGCQGLRVTVFPSGRRSFVVRYRFRGLQRKLTLGPCLVERGVAEPASAPETATPLSLHAARSLCAEALRQARSGNDPAAAKQRKRQEQLAAEADTLQALSEEFLRREGPRLRTLSQRRSDLELLCASVLGRLPVDQIKRGQYTHVLDHIADHNGPARADRVLSALKTLLNWHAERSDFISPLGRGGRRTSIQDRARSRVLTPDELRRVVTTAEQRRNDPFAAFVLFVLHTATRRSESAGLRRSELSDEGRTWIIPGARYKSKKDTLVPLSKAAQRIIAAQPELGDFVFSVTGDRALTGFTERKAEFDAACEITGWTIHDLRRTSRTLLSRAGIPADIAEMCLGHSLVGVRQTYDRHAYENEKRNAFEKLAAQIERIVRPPKPNVADMATERRRRRR